MRQAFRKPWRFTESLDGFRYGFSVTLRYSIESEENEYYYEQSRIVNLIRQQFHGDFFDAVRFCHPSGTDFATA